LKQPSGKVLQVDLTTIPLFTEQGSFAGFVVLIRDDSVQTDLESRVRTLHQIATQDPLTKVANRNELNRELESTILSHSSSGTPAAVIMCDIDYFKRINDTYSHQAGDDALVTFAGLLRDSARKDDLVARYGGEEFVILCQACDISAAHARAEDLRRLVERTPVPSLGNSQMTASFGVTVLQPGDNMETFIARADRALMTAKQTGRNRVVQLGSGGRNPSTSEADGRRAAADAEPRRSNWLSWFTSSEAPVCKREYLSAVPFGVAIQKLEGFVGDHKAEIVSTDADRVTIRVVGGQNGRRRGEHGIAMLMQVDIQQVEFFTSGRNRAYQSRTKFAVQLHPVRPRDRRHSVIEGQAHQILLSFQAYIVGEEIDEQLRKSIILPR
jgi:diguanylate cyclase (GGDEF)-like protein